MFQAVNRRGIKPAKEKRFGLDSDKQTLHLNRKNNTKNTPIHLQSNKTYMFMIRGTYLEINKTTKSEYLHD